MSSKPASRYVNQTTIGIIFAHKRGPAILYGLQILTAHCCCVQTFLVSPNIQSFFTHYSHNCPPWEQLESGCLMQEMVEYSGHKQWCSVWKSFNHSVLCDCCASCMQIPQSDMPLLCSTHFVDFHIFVPSKAILSWSWCCEMFDYMKGSTVKFKLKFSRALETNRGLT